MTSAPSLHWLPDDAGWRPRVHAFRRGGGTWGEAQALAGYRLDFVRTNLLDGAVQASGVSADAAPVRLALLGSSTLAHLHAGIRVAALRRGMALATYENEYGQYRQELADPASGLHGFAPTAILFAFDARHVAAGIHAGLDTGDVDSALERAVGEIVECWRVARAAFACPILQQTILPAFGSLLGSNEQRFPGSRAGFVRRLNAALRDRADAEGVALVALDDRAALDGLAAWHDVALWHRAKQEVTPAAAPMYGELVVRLLAAMQGRSAKCLVLDCDNTLWGGVIGDDGIDNLVLGQGSTLGEAYLAVQDHARELARRGIILAVCSKNDEGNVFEVFDAHPEMLLRRADIASFAVNWQDKAGNLRAIARNLNIGLDSLVFLDDNPAERALIRRELPMVAVPEVGDDPAFYPQALIDGGWFEAIGITGEDRARAGQYQANQARAAVKADASDMPAFLRSLEMKLAWRPFDRAGLARIVQLVNKTNQFNLTTRRYGEEEIAALIDDDRMVTLQLRLADRFGDNGMIAVVIGRLEEHVLVIDSWLMSCRVLGREVERATLAIIAGEAARRGATRLRGDYLPTAKNGMVGDLYGRLGFAPASCDADGRSTAFLSLAAFVPSPTAIETLRG